MKQRNFVQKALLEDRRWGEVHRDKKKYHREAPNHHALDSEIEEALDALHRGTDRNSEEQ